MAILYDVEQIVAAPVLCINLHAREYPKFRVSLENTVGVTCAWGSKLFVHLVT